MKVLSVDKRMNEQSNQIASVIAGLITVHVVMYADGEFKFWTRCDRSDIKTGRAASTSRADIFAFISSALGTKKLMMDIKS